MAVVSSTYDPIKRLPPWFWIGLGLVAAVMVLIIIFDWNWLRGPVANYLSHRTGREVRIGHLDGRLLSFTPRATFTDLTVSNPDWAPQGQTAEIPRLDIRARLMPLFIGRLVLPRVTVDRPVLTLFRDGEGRASWEFGASAKDNAEAFSLPPIRHFEIREGRISITDKTRDMRFVGTISSQESAREKGRTAFSMTGEGRLNRNPFSMEVTGGPLINIDRGRPYDFDMKLRAGATRVTARGAILKPFDLGGLEADVSFAGPNLADLYYLTGVVLPRTPPYRLSTHLVRDDAKYRLTAIRGKVGDSDLAGVLTVDAGSGRVFLEGNLSSRSLSFVDLGAMFGGGPSAAKLQAVAQEAGIAPAAVQPAPQNRFLPDLPLEVDRVRQMDAKLIYHADRVVSESFPLRELDLTLTLDHGVLTLDPVAFKLSQGRLAGSLKIDARKDIPAVDVDVRFRDIALAQFLPSNDPQKPIEGLLEARAKLSGTGKSVHGAAATADGTVTAVVPHGAVRKQFVELLGIDVDQALLLSGSAEQTDIRCAVADFAAQDGMLTARHIVLDTGTVNVNGSGRINLADETVDLSFQGAPKSLRLLRVRAPITVTGALSDPTVGIKPGGAAVQAGVALGLGALLTPLAAILPFVDPGLAEDANCAALLTDAKAKGAPVKAQTIKNEAAQN